MIWNTGFRLERISLACRWTRKHFHAMWKSGVFYYSISGCVQHVFIYTFLRFNWWWWWYGKNMFDVTGNGCMCFCVEKCVKCTQKIKTSYIQYVHKFVWFQFFCFSLFLHGYLVSILLKFSMLKSKSEIKSKWILNMHFIDETNVECITRYRKIHFNVQFIIFDLGFLVKQFDYYWIIWC